MRKVLLICASDFALTIPNVESQRKSFSILIAKTYEDARTILRNNEFDCLLLDLDMSEVSAHDFIREIKSDKLHTTTPVTLLSTSKKLDLSLELLNSGADDLILKDSDERIIFAKLECMARIKTERIELKKLQRMSQIGETISIYNHQFNNPLTIAMGNLHWLKKNCSDENLLPHIDRMDKALERMSDIVKKIRLLRDYVGRRHTLLENSPDEKRVV